MLRYGRSNKVEVYLLRLPQIHVRLSNTVILGLKLLKYAKPSSLIRLAELNDSLN